MARCSENTALAEANAQVRQAHAEVARRRTFLDSANTFDEFQIARLEWHEAILALSDRERARSAVVAVQKGIRADADAAKKKCIQDQNARIWRRLNKGFVPAIGITGFVDTYPFGKSSDPDDPSQSKRLEPWGGAGIEPNLSFHPSERTALDVYGRYSKRRASGAADTKLARYLEGGVTASWLAWQFLDEAQLSKSNDYVREGFIPGLAIGASLQASQCDGRDACIKKKTSQLSATPFVDIRVKPALQIRLSTVLAKFDAVDDDGQDIAPSLSLAGQIGSL